MLAIIGGTGFYEPALFSNTREIVKQTPHGTVSLISGDYRSTPFLFLARHGKGHDIPPSRIPFRANITALRELGARNIAATSAVGSMKKRLPPGSLALATQFVDFTKLRPTSLSDEVVHTDVSVPYCPALRQAIQKTARAMKVGVAPSATYVCTEGPRFETPAEIKMFSRFGDVVGMTGLPEAVMAREAGMCYASLCIVTNWAAGMQEKLSHHDFVAIMREKRKTILALLLDALLSAGKEEGMKCQCRAK